MKTCFQGVNRTNPYSKARVYRARKEKAFDTKTVREEVQKNRYITVFANRIHKLKVFSFSLQLHSLKATQK